MPPQSKGIRSTLVNVDSADGIYMMYEVPELQGQARAVWESEPELGAPHVKPVFSHTANETWQVEFRYERIALTHDNPNRLSTDQASQAIDHAWAFLRSCLTPNRLDKGYGGGSPPLLQFHVPGVLTLFCRMESINWQVKMRDPQTGQLMRLICTCGFKEDPQYRATSEDILREGYHRF